MEKEKTKSFAISKRMVWESYKKVVSKDGGAGIDNMSIEMFKEDMPKQLYKIWNRLSSGSYQPPAVRSVFIPKKQGGERQLGIPTVGDRIAQGVVKDYLEPIMEKEFHPNSFGYRPKVSALAAVKQCHEACLKRAWVLDMDIKGFFDNIDHAIMLKLLGMHTQEKWVLLYVKRWLEAGVEQKDGSIIPREKGTPQGGVISPVLANLYLHHAFDSWITELYPNHIFERYADDIVVHCRTKTETEQLLETVRARLREYGLELHPEKTKIVYCKEKYRRETYPNNSFVFLGYSYQPRVIKPHKEVEGRKYWLVFGAGICQGAKTDIRATIKATVCDRWTHQQIEWIAKRLNPKLRGWANYYCAYSKHETHTVFRYVDERLRQWLKSLYRIRGNVKVYAKLAQIRKSNPKLFYHWQLGIKS